jgi:hypothetical protein
LIPFVVQFPLARPKSTNFFGLTKYVCHDVKDIPNPRDESAEGTFTRGETKCFGCSAFMGVSARASGVKNIET